MPRGGGRDTIREIMGKFKRGELYSGPDGFGAKVDSRDQAIAIALSESGMDRRAGSNPIYSKKRYPQERESKRRKRPMFGI